MRCENCNNEHDGSYGSGRFCSSKCSRGFSTKAKRKEINEKVSKKLNKKSLIEKECLGCHTIFKTFNPRKKYCTRSCGNTLAQLGKQKRKGDTRKKGSGGFRKGGGKAKQISYINWLGFKMSLNKEEIEVAKILDERKLNWNRNYRGFPYLTKEGLPRKFYPDFVIDDNKYIEYKGWVTDEMEWKMTNSVKTNSLDLTIIIGNDKRYKRFGINLNQFRNEY